MGAWDDAWAAVQQALRELAPWHHAAAGHPAPARQGADALQALVDIGVVRRALDQTELAAVRAARAGGAPWSEIATRLGVTRQSAWERWRDLDDQVAEKAAPDPPAGGPSGRGLRARRSVKVPDVVGMRPSAAVALLGRSGLQAVTVDDIEPGGSAEGPGRVVHQQYPDAGTKVPAASVVRLWTRPGGGSAGDREPRRPLPHPPAAVVHRDEPVA